MLIVDFFRRESSTSLKKIVLMSLVSGLANGLLLALVNASAEYAWNREVNLKNLFLYAIVLVLFVYSKKFAMIEANRVVEEVLSKVRLRITDKIRESELAFIEKLGESRTFATLTQDTNLVSQTAMVMIAAASSMIMIIACLLYIASISLTAFGITIVAIAIGISLYLAHREQTFRDINQSNVEEAGFFKLLNDVLRGFQMLKMNRARSAGLFEAMRERSDQTKNLKITSADTMTVSYLFSQVFYYTLIAVLLFLLPTAMPDQAPNTMKITAAILFMMGSLDFVVGSIPLFTRSTVALHNLQQLESELDAVSLQRQAGEDIIYVPFDGFSKIELHDLEFSYRSESGDPLFTVGPSTLSVEAGEILFVVGGNGSGKSTTLRLLTGLYYPDTGYISVDEERITPSLYPSYRELFSFVPADYYLFDRLYGLEGIEVERVETLLKEMELHRKTKFVDGVFSTVDLSTGQRKRLALITALLEDRSVYVLDECAADQDPDFKRFFYEQLLPNLKKQGKTIIAVTHDDHYFHVADRVIQLDYGKIVEPRYHARA